MALQWRQVAGGLAASQGSPDFDRIVATLGLAASPSFSDAPRRRSASTIGFLPRRYFPCNNLLRILAPASQVASRGNSRLNIVIVTVADLPEGTGHTARLRTLTDALTSLGHHVVILN